MTRGTVRRLGAAGLVLGCLVVLPGPAGADPAQKFSITGPPSVNEGDPVEYTVSLTDGTDDDATVDFSATPGAGTSASDYTITPATLTVPKGGNAKFTVQANEDTTDEPNEPFTVSLSNPVRATIETGSVTTTIVDDDAGPTLAISGPAPIAEGAVNATYTVAITGTSSSTVVVNYATANGSATAGANLDYDARNGQLSWAPGDTNAKSFVVPIREDTLDEFDENFTANLSSPVGATITTGTATTTITDDDPDVSIATVSNFTVVEGNTGTVDAPITVTLSAASGKTVTVPYATAPASASDGADYEQKSGNYVFVPGDVSETVVFKVKGDTIYEQPDETFSVVLFTPTNATAGNDMLGEITIDDDDSTPALTLTSPSIAEGNSGETDLNFEASLACPHAAVTFNYRTAADTATAGSDYIEVGGAQFTFPACGAGLPTKVTFPIKIKGDPVDEPNESFNVELLNPNQPTVVVTRAKGTILNDDSNSKLAISDASADEPGTMTFTVTLSAASALEVKVNWETANGTATAGADYTAGSGQLTFAPGDTTKTIAVAVLGDETTEENETLKVNLSSPTNSSIVDGQGDGTIVDKNAPPSLSISDAITREGEGATFTVTLAGTTLRTVTVSFNTIEATAKAGTDFAARAGTLSFAPGEKSKTIAVTILDDTVAEPTEDFFVGIGDAVNATITKNRGLGAIEASDQIAQPPTTDPKNPPVGKPTSVLVPRMILGPRTISIGANGVARMLVTCQKLSPIGCAGTVELERAARPLLKLGKKTFTVKKGTKGYAAIKLSPKTLKLLKKNGTMRAKVIVLVKTSSKTMKVSPGIITLKATKALKKAKPAPPPTKVVVDP